MKFIIPIVLCIILCTGCIQFQSYSQYEYVSYPLNTKIEQFTTTLPNTIQLPAVVSLDVYYPDGTSKGTYSVTTNKRDVSFSINNITLYQTGIYIIKYTTYNNIIYDYIFAGSVSNRLVPVITSSTVENNRAKITIMNDGTSSGFFYICLFVDGVVIENSINSERMNYFNDVIHIKNGYTFEIDEYIPSDNVYLLINREIYKL